ncbi:MULTISPECIES: serine/threonine-protein kinase PknK [Sorangium]|uniref:Protein kinase n=1 Tax=Sorangium cellulosum TaxID=56 RepID=A0A4P2QWE9_SORCE|nr:MULTISPECIES: serine/threonine-protein kinase [Sorangium]AUX34789.1 protein kinase [Sorangium cellulosum]WCQ94102.1 serine-threonine kinase [Sorangium sp. Soce836]
MRSEASPDEGPDRAPIEARRCPSCGRRNEGVCPECGALGPSSLPDDATVLDVTEVVPVALPCFEGYRTVRILGQGGFGTVFEAEREDGGATVAIKLARADRRGAGARLRREVEALLAVGAPHVPAVHAWGTLDDGSPYAVIDLVAAPTLAVRLALRPAPRVEEAARLGLATLAALEAVHARGYVHCDLKPENIFVDPAGKATLIDLGIARVVGRRDGAQDADLALGTAEYMAPEQSAGRADLDARADIYAMGVILYELFAGRPPFWGPRAAVLEDHRSRRPPRLSARAAVPRAIEDVVHRCLLKDRSERFASATELRAALERALGEDLAASERDGARTGGGALRRPVGLLFFEGVADRGAVQRKVRALGGELAHASGSRYAAVFGHEGAASPARHAQRAADELLRGGLCARVLIDLAPVSVQARPGGATRFLSPLFSRAERWPAASGPPGPFLTPAAAAALPEASAAAEDELARERTLGSVGVAREPTDPGALIGRRDVLDRLLHSAEEALRLRQPTVVSVIGEPGYGKSRVFAELGRQLRARLPHAQLIDLRGQEPTSGASDATLQELVRVALDVPDAPPQSGVRAVLAERLGPALGEDLGSGLAMALGWVDERTGGEVFPEIEALRAAPGALRSARVRAAGECLRRRAAAAPVAVILDDAQFAQDVTLAALEYAALADGAAPLWICAMGRPAFAEAHPSWGERAARREAVRLGPLDAESARALCRRLLLPARDVPESAIDHLLERSQRVPLLLVELVHGLKREGVLRRHPRGDAWYLATDELDRLPALPLIDPLAEAEVAALGSALGAHARLVSLLGAEVSLDEVAGVLRHLDERGEGAAFPLDARVGTERLVEAGVLVAGRKGRFAFRHALVREAIAHGVALAERRRIHLAAYEHHREVAHESVEQGRFKIAFHAAEAGLAAIAEEAYLELAERARARHAYVEAEIHYSRALAQPVEERGARRRAAYRGRGLMRYRLGRYHDALGDFDRARAMAVEEGDAIEQVEILLDEATALDWMDDYGRSKERVEQARAIAPSALPPALAARLSMSVARSLARESREKEAAPQLELAAAQAEALGDEGYETLVVSLVLLSFIYPGLGKLDEAGGALERTIRMCESRGDLLHLGPAISNRALLRACLGDNEGMLLDLCRVLATSRELGLGTMELVGEFNLGEYLYLMGNLEMAMPHVERAVALERQQRGEEARPVVHLLLARLLLYRGDEGKAREIIEEIRAQQAKAAAEGRSGAEMAPAEEVQWSMIDLATRDASDEAWDELEERSARFSVGQEQIEVIEARARALSRRGRHADARAALERAAEAAGRIPNVMRERISRQREGSPGGASPADASA